MHPDKRFVKEQAAAFGTEIHDGPLAFKPDTVATFPDLWKTIVCCKKADRYAFIGGRRTCGDGGEREQQPGQRKTMHFFLPRQHGVLRMA